MPDSLVYIDNAIIKEYISENEEFHGYVRTTPKFTAKEEVKEEITISEPEVIEPEEIEPDQDLLMTNNIDFIPARFEELKIPLEKRPWSLALAKDPTKINDILDFGVQRAHGGTISLKYSKEDYMEKIRTYIPIESRIYKSPNTSLDLVAANTLISAQRNLVNDGTSRQATLTKDNSLSFEQLSKLEANVGEWRRKDWDEVNSLKVPIVLYSSKTLDTLNNTKFEMAESM